MVNESLFHLALYEWLHNLLEVLLVLILDKEIQLMTEILVELFVLFLNVK